MKQHLQFCVYKITNSISGKSYIGKTKDLKSRWKGHKSSAKTKNINNKFPNALRKYSEDTWDISILYETDDETHCYEVEALLIDEYDTFKFGYNMTVGGIGLGSGEDHPAWNTHLSKTRKLKMSNSLSGENHHMFNKHLSKSHKEKISKSIIGFKQLEETKKKISDNSAMKNLDPWLHPNCLKYNLQINWFYLDKVYGLRTKYGYGQSKIYNILVKDYPNIKKSPKSFQNMFRWINKNGNPSEHKEWLEFRNNLFLN